jgi:hypothetical protein
VAVGQEVPDPNNTDATFNEFPAFPRMDLSSSVIATRGQSTPVYSVTLPDGTETRLGTAGIYTNAGGALRTAMSQLGSLPDFTYFAVPGAVPGTRFDQFPGAPAPFNRTFVAFKGNYTEGGVAKTGVYIRDAMGSSGEARTCLIANSNMRIPNQATGGSVKFGSTAPPSAGWSRVYFAGFDNEDTPTLGGIYRSPAKCNPVLTTLVGVGSAVPGLSGATFTRFGEALSLGGNYLGFWGSWGTQTRRVTLQCPQDGNQDLINYCRSQYPNGYTTSVPVNQGIFIYNNGASVPASQRLKLIARTGTKFKDFLFWVFSGRPPGAAAVRNSRRPKVRGGARQPSSRSQTRLCPAARQRSHSRP